MFVLFNLLVSDSTLSIVLATCVYICLYTYFLIYDDTYYPIFIKFILYFIVLDLILALLSSLYYSDNGLFCEKLGDSDGDKADGKDSKESKEGKDKSENKPEKKTPKVSLSFRHSVLILKKVLYQSRRQCQMANASDADRFNWSKMGLECGSLS